MLAYRRIRSSGGRLRGENVAKAAIFAGLVLAIMSFVLWTQIYSSRNKRIGDVVVRDFSQFSGSTKLSASFVLPLPL